MSPPYVYAERSEFERFCRATCQAVWLGADSVLCRVLGKYLFYTDPQDVGITPHLCLDGFWESWITIALARQIRPGWHCVDVGAHCGYYTTLMADAVGETGRVLAIEPNPDLTSRLQLTLEANGLLDRSTVLTKAAANRSGCRTALAVPHKRPLNATICRDAGPDDRVFEVETISLDDATRDWKRVDFVKIDAEGAEESIWQGLQRTVCTNPDLRILMEFKPWLWTAPRLFLEQILADGFWLRHVDFEGGLQELSLEQVLEPHPAKEWMLFLDRDRGAELSRTPL
jgi:FkbM family methyltransferase